MVAVPSVVFSQGDGVPADVGQVDVADGTSVEEGAATGDAVPAGQDQQDTAAAGPDSSDATDSDVDKPEPLEDREQVLTSINDEADGGIVKGEAAPAVEVDRGAFALSLPSNAPRQDVVANSFSVAAPDVVELGWGWSEQRVEPIPTTCIEFEKREDRAQTSTITIQEVSDSYTLSKALDISASASIQAFGGNVNAKTSMTKNSQVSSMSVTYVVRAEVLNSSTYVAPQSVRVAADPGDDGVVSVGPAVRLTPEARTLAKNDVDKFRRVCGDGYVSAEVTGARAYLVSVVKTTSKQQRETVKASVSGSGWGQKVSLAATGRIEEKTDGFRRDLTFFQEGGSATPAPVNIDDDENPVDGQPAASDLPKDAEAAIARITKLASAATDAPKVFEISISPYEALENYPSSKKRQRGTDEYESLAALMGAYFTLYNDFAEALANPADYAVPLQVCGEGNCTAEMVRLTDPNAFKLAEDMQDIALAGLAELDSIAEPCLSEEGVCEPDTGRVRSPYAIYNNAPMPAPTGEGVDVAIDIADHTTVFMRDIAASRCALGAASSGCITNAMIRAWETRKGMTSFAVENTALTLASLTNCAGNDKVYQRADADNMELKVVWAPPSFTLKDDGNFVCPKDPSADPS